ncbi:hypothetical protein SLEP1_g22999 [Rubroshorea leprosula]|uniref:Uncharacterized protein n=1 Tax=Rubroshorea leprosula TaxID=152421 RepID=A0AAV5JB36_9ROSI|nr:hypothetical protein SLEP1_g22999 [Rubroshorea leprosula]
MIALYEVASLSLSFTRTSTFLLLHPPSLPLRRVNLPIPCLEFSSVDFKKTQGSDLSDSGAKTSLIWYCPVVCQW